MGLAELKTLCIPDNVDISDTQIEWALDSFHYRAKKVVSVVHIERTGDIVWAKAGVLRSQVGAFYICDRNVWSHKRFISNVAVTPFSTSLNRFIRKLFL